MQKQTRARSDLDAMRPTISPQAVLASLTVLCHESVCQDLSYSDQCPSHLLSECGMSL